uniref:Uncharacterized protein n=1 Tax=Lactuca sativa TaxID=4236 RepID=A0A9R1VPA4_LACSA|nr:hypothetical protein LSAT_V11C500275560 [Lactuca sativa]
MQASINNKPYKELTDRQAHTGDKIGLANEPKDATLTGPNRFHIPIMVDSLISLLSTFHTTKIIVTDPFDFPFNGSIPASMYACVPDASKLLLEYTKLPSFGPRELTPEMIKSIEEVDKLAKRGKNPNLKKKEKEGQVSKVTTPKKRKSEKAAPSQLKKKNVKKMARNPRRVSTSDSHYTPSDKQPNTLTSESESSDSDDEGSVHGGTPPISPMHEVPIH